MAASTCITQQSSCLRQRLPALRSVLPAFSSVYLHYAAFYPPSAASTCITQRSSCLRQRLPALRSVLPASGSVYLPYAAFIFRHPRCACFSACSPQYATCITQCSSCITQCSTCVMQRSARITQRSACIAQCSPPRVCCSFRHLCVRTLLTHPVVFATSRTRATLTRFGLARPSAHGANLIALRCSSAPPALPLLLRATATELVRPAADHEDPPAGLTLPGASSPLWRRVGRSACLRALERPLCRRSSSHRVSLQLLLQEQGDIPPALARLY